MNKSSNPKGCVLCLPACLPLPGSSVSWTAHHSCLWCEVRWRPFKRSALLFLETKSVCVKYQSNSTQVESVSNNVLIYACACPSWKERAWKRQKREQQSQSWRILTCSCQACTVCVYVYVWVCLYMCACLSDDSGLLPSFQTAHWSPHAKPLCNIQFPHCIMFVVSDIGCKWMMTKTSDLWCWF